MFPARNEPMTIGKRPEPRLFSLPISIVKYKTIRPSQTGPVLPMEQNRHNFTAIPTRYVSATLVELLHDCSLLFLSLEKNRTGTVQDIVQHLESHPPRNWVLLIIYCFACSTFCFDNWVNSLKRCVTNPTSPIKSDHPRVATLGKETTSNQLLALSVIAYCN